MSLANALEINQKKYIKSVSLYTICTFLKTCSNFFDSLELPPPYPLSLTCRNLEDFCQNLESLVVTSMASIVA